MSATMIPLSNETLLTDAEMRRLREGSYEDKVARIREAVLANSADHFAEGSTVEVIATHPDRVVVTADGKFYEAKIDETNSGELRIVGVTALQVESYDKDNLAHYVQREAQQAVDLFLKGSTKAAIEHMMAAVPFVNASTVQPGHSLESLQIELDKESTWKAILKDRDREIGRLISDQLGESAVRPEEQKKFSPLYECRDEQKLTGYSSLVQEDLESLLSRIGTFEKDASDAQGTAAKVLEGREINDEDVLGVFSSFVATLVEDLQQLKACATAVSEAVTNDVAVKGRLHDVLIEGLRPYEIGTRFAVAVAQRLDEAK